MTRDEHEGASDESALQRARTAAASLALANARLEKENLELRAQRRDSQEARNAAVVAQRGAEASRDASRDAERRAQFLAEVGRVLAQSLEYSVTLEALARLLVPELADYCVVEIADAAGTLRPLAVAHADPSRRDAVRWLHVRFADDPAAAYGAPGVLRSGQAELVHDVAESVAARSRGGEHLALVRGIGLVSSVILPLTADGSLVGALTLGATKRASGGSDRHFTTTDLLYAEDVARRASVAIENARLHETLAEAHATLETQQAELEMQQLQLQEQHAELEMQSATLQEQAVEMEAQADELQSRNEALERTNAALEQATAVAEAATVVAEAARRAATRAEAVANDANAAKSQFLANMSHELRTPLNAIAGYADLLDLGVEGPVTDGQRNYLARLGRAQKHLLTLINDVLSFAKLEVGQTEIRLEAVDVGEVCARLEELVRPQLDAKTLRYDCALQTASPSDALVVRADRDRMLQILVNLVGNAVKFTPAGGSIRVAASARPDDADVSIRVADSGRGIAADQQRAVFDPFVQVDLRSATPREGVGLGLTISRDLARAMGGDITLESEIGVGSTFTLTLPRG